MKWNSSSLCVFDGVEQRLSQAKISIAEPALSYGLGAFDMVNAVPDGDGFSVYRLGGEMEFADQEEMYDFVHSGEANNTPEYGHLDRLEFSASTMGGIGKLPVSKTDLRHQFASVLRMNASEYKQRHNGELPTFYVRFQAWQGEKYDDQPIGVANDAPARYAILVAAHTGYLPEGKKKGVMIVDQTLIPPTTMDPQAKAFPRYGITGNATHLARRNDCVEALLIDPVTGNIGEGAGENLFCYGNGKFYVSRSPSALNGFTQHALVTLADGTKEIDLNVESLRMMDSIVLTGTAAGAEPINFVKSPEGNVVWERDSVPDEMAEIIRQYNEMVSGRLPEYEDMITRISLDF